MTIYSKLGKGNTSQYDFLSGFLRLIPYRGGVMTKDSFRMDWVLALALLLIVVPVFLFGPDLRSATGTIMNWPVQSHMAATTYFTQDLYTLSPALQKKASGVAPIDFNNDGFVDLLVFQMDVPPEGPFNLAPILAYTNDGTGHFTESTAMVLGNVGTKSPSSFSVADFNGDSLNDIFITDMGTDRAPWDGSRLILLMQKPNGTLVDEAASRFPPFPYPEFHPYDSSAGDIDGDDDIDLVYNGTGGAVHQLLVNDGQGYFSNETEQRFPEPKPNWMANNSLMLDIENDGDLDIFFGEEAPHYPQDFILLNDGFGYFNYAPDNTLPLRNIGNGLGAADAHASDLNGDGWLDLVLSGMDATGGGIQVLFNNGDGTFQDVSNLVAEPDLKTWLGWGNRRIADVNGDGWPDLLTDPAVWPGSYCPHLYINHAASSFEDITTAVWSFHEIRGEPQSGEFVDIDNDGDMDVIGVYPDENHVNNQFYILINQTPYVISEDALPYPGIPILRTPGNGDLVNGFQVFLTWNVVPTAYSYRIQVAEDSGFSRTIFDRRVTTNSLRMTDMIGNTTYHWRVQAINTRGTGSWSLTNYFTAALPVYPPANAQLQRLTINYGFFKVYTNRLTWQANPETLATVINYRIYRKPKNESDSSYSLLAELPAATVTYDDRGLRSAQLYTYRITAFSSQDIESEPATIGN